MKQVKLFFLTLLCLLLSTTAKADDRPITVDQLPAAAKTFIKKHFSQDQVVEAEMEKNFRSVKYDVKFSSGSEVDFNAKGTWISVDCERSAVPAAIIPAAIKKYVSTKYKGETINKIERETYGYEVELSNDLELKFNRNGKFIAVTH